MRVRHQTETEFAAFVGIDWADQKHAWALKSSGDPGVEQGNLAHRPETVEAWAAELARRFGGRPIAVALEQSRGSLLFLLAKYGHLVLFPVPPITLANYRKGFPAIRSQKRPFGCDSVSRHTGASSRKVASPQSRFRTDTHAAVPGGRTAEVRA
jgi:hypothetical protein